ncbi:MAG: DUF5671 domain-containing protein [Patescibacteria group bacterium]|jgi:uncharacterized membrane protein YidH (DUF202 family)
MPSNNSSYRGKGALDAFLNLLSFISLGWMSWAIGGIAFQLINRYLAESLKLQMYYPTMYSQEVVKYAIASLIIVVPVYFLAVNLLHRNYKKNKLNHNSGIYRWLTYLMLLVSALTIIGALVRLIFIFLNGEQTWRVALKILTVVAIAAGIFSYYFYDLRRKAYQKYSPTSLVFAIVLVAVVLVELVAGLMIIDSPTVTRNKQLDSQLVNDMTQINYLLEIDYQQDGAVPVDLSAAKYKNVVEAVKSDQIEYNRQTANEFEFCATFLTDATADNSQSWQGENWYYHGVGRQCFTKKVLLPKADVAPEAIKGETPAVR